jgi:hypothetical protein
MASVASVVVESSIDLDRSVSRIRTFRAEGAVAMWRIGVELSSIHGEHLWKQRLKPDSSVAYRSFSHFCTIELGIRGSSACELIDVSRKFDETEVAAFGTSKFLYLLRTPHGAKARIRRMIEAGASQRDIKVALQAAREKYGVVGKKRITGRKVVGGLVSPRAKCVAPAPSTTRILAALAMALGHNGGDVVLTMTRRDAVFLRSILRAT